MSPGTFLSETTEKPVESWDVPLGQIVEMARDISERHGAKPYGFRFVTYERRDDELNPRRTKISGIHYLGGKVETLSEIEERDDPAESVLRTNMRCNRYDKVVVNTNSWKFIGPLERDDVVLDVTL